MCENSYPFVYSVKIVAISNSTFEQDLHPVATQVASYIERLYPGGKLVEGVILILYPKNDL